MNKYTDVPILETEKSPGKCPCCPAELKYTTRYINAETGKFIYDSWKCPNCSLQGRDIYFSDKELEEAGRMWENAFVKEKK